MITGYHFVGAKLRNGSPIPANGEWLDVGLPIQICERGLHASLHVSDALQYAPGNTLCLVELDGEHQDQDDKVCYQRRRIIARFDATELLHADARASALSVAHLWDMPPIVRQYLETGNDTLRKDAAAYTVYASVARYDDAAYAVYAAAYAVDARYAAASGYAAHHTGYAAAYAANAVYAAAYAANAVYAAAYDTDATAAAYAAANMRKANRDRLQAAVDAKFKELLK